MSRSGLQNAYGMRDMWRSLWQFLLLVDSFSFSGHRARLALKTWLNNVPRQPLEMPAFRWVDVLIIMTSPVIQGKAWVKQTFTAGDLNLMTSVFWGYWLFGNVCIFNFDPPMFSISINDAYDASCLPWSQVLRMPLQCRHWPDEA